MLSYALPIGFALFVWWFSTGLIIYLDGLPRHTFRWSMLGASALFVAALYGLAVSSRSATLAGAYWAFTAGVIAWGWQEISFYMGFVTGPRRAPCEEGCHGWRHFVHAVETSLYHELAIIAAAAAVIALTWGEPNQVGTFTFMILWWMHQSAKLNVFLGVRNLNEEFLPEHLNFLKSFLTKRPMNLLFPVSITVSTVIATVLIADALSPAATPFDRLAYIFLGTMMTLAILEHWFLVLPLPAAKLWSWCDLVSPAELRVIATTLQRLNPEVAIVPAIFGIEQAGELSRELFVLLPHVADAAHNHRDLRDRSGTEDHADHHHADHHHAHSHHGEHHHGEAAFGFSAWSHPLGFACDAGALEAVLIKVAEGAYGHIERVKGIARAGDGWVHFDVAGGRPSMAAFAPAEGEVARVVAIGREVDEPGLEHAFEACAALSGA
ncbi:MAG: putative photosynthetic complex assembly protein PuhE [Acidibrevibacterium sp.]|uniref:putative photosynthetic complex assembly protein PuhE n=1 Tax=Acidibrevibacterium sp. TaxID=2606776 RepID=UPI003CFD400C